VRVSSENSVDLAGIDPQSPKGYRLFSKALRI
jgi:hypothetical protein